MSGFWELVLSAAVGISAALISRLVKWIPPSDIVFTVIVAAVPYALFILVRITFNAIRAPARLDQRRVVQIRALRDSARVRISELKENHRIESSRLAEAARQREAATRVPAISALEQNRRDLVAEGLKSFDSDEREALKYILNSGQVNAMVLESRFGGPVRDMWRRMLNKGVPTGLLKPDGRSLRISAELVNALAFHLLGK